MPCQNTGCDGDRARGFSDKEVCRHVGHRTNFPSSFPYFRPEQSDSESPHNHKEEMIRPGVRLAEYQFGKLKEPTENAGILVNTGIRKISSNPGTREGHTIKHRHLTFSKVNRRRLLSSDSLSC